MLLPAPCNIFSQDGHNVELANLLILLIFKKFNAMGVEEVSGFRIHFCSMVTAELKHKALLTQDEPRTSRWQRHIVERTKPDGRLNFRRDLCKGFVRSKSQFVRKYAILTFNNLFQVGNIF